MKGLKRALPMIVIRILWCHPHGKNQMILLDQYSLKKTVYQDKV
jgi:putative component of membrane protein insertase Oxa1/YidC/SpoIIIJ protein YidD